MSGKPGSSNPGTTDRNVVKKNLNLSIEIINKCFNNNVAKCVQIIGLFYLQPLLQDYKQLYYPYVDVLINIDDNFKFIIINEDQEKSKFDIFV